MYSRIASAISFPNGTTMNQRLCACFSLAAPFLRQSGRRQRPGTCARRSQHWALWNRHPTAAYARSCLLYRMRDVYVTSDRFMTDDGLVGKPPDYSVYYALTETAQHYLWSLPQGPV